MFGAGSPGDGGVISRSALTPAAIDPPVDTGVEGLAAAEAVAEGATEEPPLWTEDADDDDGGDEDDGGVFGNPGSGIVEALFTDKCSGE